jgi:hypothetical protein
MALGEEDGPQDDVDLVPSWIFCWHLLLKILIWVFSEVKSRQFINSAEELRRLTILQQSFPNCTLNSRPGVFLNVYR